MQNQILEHGLSINRRRFLSRLGMGVGSVALGSLLIPDLFGSKEEEMILTGLPHFAPKAKRIIYLFQNGAPSQLDLFDYKPKLQGDVWRRPSGINTHGPTPYGNDGRPEEISIGGHNV